MSYIIKYKDNSKEIVPDVIAEACFEAKTPKINWSNKNGKKQIDLTMISKLLPLKEYYEQYPEERPPSQTTNKYLPEKTEHFSKEKLIEKNKKRLNILIKSLKSYMASDRYNNSQTTKNLLKAMENKLESLNKLTN